MKNISTLIVIFSLFVSSAFAASSGQAVLVPVYSHIYTGDHAKEFMLAATVTLRNTDTKSPITVLSADYYGSDGKLIKKFQPKPSSVKPLASQTYIIKESDRSGGSGASMIITWKASSPVSEPIAEAVMIGAKSQQGISFTSQGRVIKEAK